MKVKKKKPHLGRTNIKHITISFNTVMRDFNNTT